MTDTQQQLSALLGREVKQLRRTDEAPPRVSIIDVAALITGKDKNQAAEDFRRLTARHPDVKANCFDVKFRDSRGRRGQKVTPVTDARGIVEIIMLLGGHHAARVRRQAATILVRYLGGDLALVDEVCQIRGFQEQLAVRAPADPRRLFGEAVEVAVGTTGTVDERMTQMCVDLVARAVPVMIDRLTAHIDERLAHLEERQRVNLNVRAPKRTAPYHPQITRDIAGARPFPVAKFLDEKEREDPTWKGVRRSFAPTFGMQVQVLKKKKLKEDGVQPVYVEQNQRAQLLYTVEDRELMQAAWELTSAHREDIAGRPGNPQAVPMVHDRPSVMDMLRGGRE